MASPRRSTKRRSSKRSPKKNSWVRKLMAWRKANKHKDGTLPSMKRAMKACKGKSAKRSKCRKSPGRKSVKRSSKRRSYTRRSTKRTSKRRSSKRRSSKRRSSKRRSSKRRSTKRKSSKRRSTKRKSSKRRSTKRKSPKRKSSKRRSSKKSSKRRSYKRRSSPTRKLRKYYPSFVGKRFQKFERRMPRYAAASANNAPYTGPTLMIGDISSQQKEERLKDEQARESAEQKENLYAALDIQKTDSQDEIKKAYRKMALKNHPDRGGNIETFQKIGKAYRILSNERAKKVYDDAYKPGIFA